MKLNINDKSIKNVDDHLETFPQKVKDALEQLRTEITVAAPKAEEVISYRIPRYKYKGSLVHFVARKDYCSFIVVSKSILEKVKDELNDYDISGTTIHFLSNIHFLQN